MGLARRSGLQAEVLASLALVMASATAVLAVVLVVSGEALVRPLLVRALTQEARARGPLLSPIVPGTTWWVVRPDGSSRPRDGAGGPADAEALALAAESHRSRSTLLRIGRGDGPLRVAVPLDATGRVAVARLPIEASDRFERAPRRIALGVLLADALVFTVFGFSVLRRRLVLPLRRLRDAAEAVAAGDWAARVPVEGPRETADLAAAFNTMTETLEARSEALEKAVANLRSVNRDLRKARAGLDRAERLAAVGSLAAGVAHEVGNPMGAVLAFLDLAGRDPGLGAEGRSYLERAGREGQRVREILRQLLDFSRPPRYAPRCVDLGAAAEEVAGMVRAQRRWAQLEVAVELEEGALLAWADPGAVTQILLNLVLNACDAARSRVCLRVAPAVFEVREGEALDAVPTRRRADAVACRLEDDGPGVAPEDRERIFDPFFTTKDPGEGTGLGLANALRLAEENGGALDLEEASQGAAFVLRLPAVAENRGRAASDVRST